MSRRDAARPASSTRASDAACTTLRSLIGSTRGSVLVDVDGLQVLRLVDVLVGKVVGRIARPEVDAADTELIDVDEVAPERHALIHRVSWT